MNARTGATPASLSPLSAPCPKCGSELRTLVWVPAAGAPDVDDAPVIRLDPREHLRVICASCGFVRAAAPEDSKR